MLYAQGKTHTVRTWHKVIDLSKCEAQSSNSAHDHSYCMTILEFHL